MTPQGSRTKPKQPRNVPGGDPNARVHGGLVVSMLLFPVVMTSRRQGRPESVCPQLTTAVFRNSLTSPCAAAAALVLQSPQGPGPLTSGKGLLPQHRADPRPGGAARRDLSPFHSRGACASKPGSSSALDFTLGPLWP